VTRSQNAQNRAGLRANNTSGVHGVSRFKGGWLATVCHEGHSYYAGYFAELADAEAAVIAKRNELFTHNDLDRVEALNL
jgi:hypothetical protein